jgi:hypothetical protein
MIDKEQIETLIEVAESIDENVKALKNKEIDTDKIEELLERLNDNLEKQNEMFEILLESIRLLGK